MLTGRENLTPREAAQISPITLAFVGDAVYSLYVRERLTLDVGGKTAQLQRASIKTVSAKGQSAFMDKLLPAFTEEEADAALRSILAEKSKGMSVRRAIFNLSGGDDKLMLRLQNKYRNTLK
ncbi:MAG: hypothetical protein IIX02_02355, partial [Clostridia bacterium]|nr:hypothetical protein [Clostridia bacterium]